MVSVTKATLVSSVWENFYDRLNGDTDVTGVLTLSDSKTQTVQTITGSFPDKITEEKSNYPIIVINSPSFDDELFTLTKTQANGRITIDVYATKSEAADKMIDRINDSIETYKGSFADLGLRMINRESVDSDSAFRGKIKLHLRSVTFSFLFRFTKTLAY